jgi:hypothetical protein
MPYTHTALPQPSGQLRFQGDLIPESSLDSSPDISADISVRRKRGRAGAQKAALSANAEKQGLSRRVKETSDDITRRTRHFIGAMEDQGVMEQQNVAVNDGGGIVQETPPGVQSVPTEEKRQPEHLEVLPRLDVIYSG